MKSFHMKTGDLEVWKSLLADSEKQWKAGYSAYELAHAWTQTSGLPKSIQTAFTNSDFERFKILYAFPEHQVYLNNNKAPSQNDLFILGKVDQDLVVIMVEGKVEEPFGELVKDWLLQASEGKKERLTFLKDKLRLSPFASIDHIRYQLLHRAASAVIEAENLNVKKAIMLVHSFSQNDSWFADYAYFVSMFGLKAQKNALTQPVLINGVHIVFGWVSDKPSKV
jgi:hypothetical protein